MEAVAAAWSREKGTGRVEGGRHGSFFSTARGKEACLYSHPGMVGYAAGIS
jgi:hypothetical protein